MAASRLTKQCQLITLVALGVFVSFFGGIILFITTYFYGLALETFIFGVVLVTIGMSFARPMSMAIALTSINKNIGLGFTQYLLAAVVGIILSNIGLYMGLSMTLTILITSTLATVCFLIELYSKAEP